ncbi:MAG: hypothetical protein GY727_04875 [Gammaproteobacteria bacterium]|nr:hypothetical protein [Gammaproteobacteria bacterium]MCP4277742.1 hypothetical protein [Gammaproteobacteria bacterium]MCP4832798.1 hypothetical protein [Gammaproteobacteria bacterium]
MLSSIQEGILRALSQAIRPIASIFLKSGLGYVQFEEVFKVAFISVAAEEFGVRDRETNTSRIAVMTGLTRKEVARLRKVDFSTGLDWFEADTVLGRLLKEWSNNKRYQKPDGSLIDISFNDGDLSFCSLVRRVGGDLPPGAVRAELKRIGAVVELAEGFLRLTKQESLPDNLDERLPSFLRNGLENIGATIAYNSNPQRSASPFFQRIIDSSHINHIHHERLEATVKEKIAEFGSRYSEGVISILESDQNKADKKDGETINAGIGVYFFKSTFS